MRWCEGHDLPAVARRDALERGESGDRRGRCVLGSHNKFERADTLNRTDWFEHANDKYGECMKAHAEGVGSVFDMSNYWNWYNEKV